MGAFTKLEQVVSLTIAPALNFSLFTLGDIKKLQQVHEKFCIKIIPTYSFHCGFFASKSFHIIHGRHVLILKIIIKKYECFVILFSILTFVNHFSLTIPLLQQQYEQQKWNSSLTKKNQQILKTINGVVQPAHKKSSSDQKVHSSRKIKNWKNNRKVEKKIPHPRSAHCQPIQIPLCLSLCVSVSVSLSI